MDDNGCHGRPAKRQADHATVGSAAVPPSAVTPVSPPRKRQRADDEAVQPEGGGRGTYDSQGSSSSSNESKDAPFPGHFRSPFQLTAIRDLPASDNVDAVTVQDVFGDPRVVECWEFNYCHDIPFILSAFADPKTIRLHVVHGFWERKDERRLQLEADVRAAAAPDAYGPDHIHLHAAFLPDKYSTHHTKMAVLIRSDATVQIAIFTANMIPRDWANLTQAVWRSPLLPLLRAGHREQIEGAHGAVGRRFKADLLNYLRSYNRPQPFCEPLIELLLRHDFSAVRAALIASVPGKHDVDDLGRERAPPRKQSYWGWAAMMDALRSVPVRPRYVPTARPSEIVVQMSSIAQLGTTNWLQKTLFNALAGGRQVPASFSKTYPRPRFRIVFPTADEIRRSLDGYEAGRSIHTKVTLPHNRDQLLSIRPMLCHWANDGEEGEPLPSYEMHGDARRMRAAPHIKTYVRFSGEGEDKRIDWALLTSANLSRQAWGEEKSALGIMRIASYEMGVLVWPELFAEGATMQPTFQADSIREESSGGGSFSDSSGSSGGGQSGPPVVALRMPYSLPLQAYGRRELPWAVSIPHTEPDWRGETWPPAEAPKYFYFGQ